MDPATPPGFAFDRISTVDQVASRLRQMIWRGDLPPGFRLKELSLADSFGVSRNTIRDAIRDLVQDGLLTRELHRGAVVRELSVDDVTDLFRVRRLLEISAIDQPDMTDDELENLSKGVAGLRRALEEKNWDGAVAADRAFHAAIVELHRSPRIVRFYEQISAETRFVLGILWLNDATKEDFADVVADVADEHRAIYESIESGERREAQRLLEAHLTTNEARLLEILQATIAAAD
jgi:DNA-binding GntR family transcriptional regulator